MIKTLLNSMASGLEVSNEDAHMPSIQKGMAIDHVEDAKTGQAICETSPFINSSFVKTLRNLQSLELPAPFVKQHGHNFQATVVLQGPSGRLTAVHLGIKSYPIQDRVHFGGSEWRDFVLENGFKVGHQLLFALVSKSTFTVRHVSGAANVSIQEYVDRVKNSKISHDMSRENLPERNRASERLVGVRYGRGSSEARYSVPESPINNPITQKSSESHVKSDVVYARGSWKWKRNVDILVGKLQCPHFVATITKSHLRDWKSSTLAVPRDFYNKYATYFSEGTNIFQGPNGRMMKLRFSNNSLRFTSGWKAFHRENDIKLGDVLLFSLREPACWLIQLVERQLEEVQMETECDNSDLE